MSTIFLLVTLFAAGQSASSEACYKKLDLFFGLDGSSSICGDDSCPEWGQILQFVQNIVSNFNIGPDDTRVAINTVSNQGKLEFNFDQYLDKNSLSSAIKNIPNPGGELNSVLSLGNLLTSSVKAAVSQRPDAIMIAIGITDGAPIANNPLTVATSTALQALGMNACVICVTDRCPADLAKSGSSPPREINTTFYQVKDYSSLGSTSENLLKQICSFKKKSVLGSLIDGVSNVFG